MLSLCNVTNPSPHAVFMNVIIISTLRSCSSSPSSPI
uniref:Uncharacterized protein n=1 Tax=Anguilla anguilla TaxID=7936 RepID=A0A0E9VP57_ANGAN